MTLYFRRHSPKIQGMIPRTIAKNVTKALEQIPAVALLGPRQVGKTTLAKTIAEHINSLYLDLEAPEDLLKLSDPGSFLTMHKDKLLILDEIQRVPDLFMVLRGVIDRNRQGGRKNGQFLLLGSASKDLLRQSSESLAGRIRYIEMSGLNALEVAGQKTDLQKLWIRGGFPESYLASHDDQAMEWLEDLIKSYLERDIPQMGFRVPAARLRRLWTMLAHLQGETVNYSKLAMNLEVDGKTASHYLDILTDLLLVRRLEPWHANIKKRLIKSPRYYIRDSGIVHRLLGIGNHDSLISNPILGKSWEGFIIENIHANLPRQAESYFYRTAAGAEIDLVLTMPNSEVWAVEIKYGSAPKIKPTYNITCEDIGATHKFIIYGGDDAYPIGNNITMLSLTHFLNKLTEKYND
jgi:predicted AAA+ superfamily ATPase